MGVRLRLCLLMGCPAAWGHRGDAGDQGRGLPCPPSPRQPWGALSWRLRPSQRSLGLTEPPRGVSRHRGHPAPHWPRSTLRCSLGHRVRTLLSHVLGDPLHVPTWDPRAARDYKPCICARPGHGHPNPGPSRGNPDSRALRAPQPGWGMRPSSAAPCVPGHPKASSTRQGGCCSPARNAHGVGAQP